MKYKIETRKTYETDADGMAAILKGLVNEEVVRIVEVVDAVEETPLE